MSELLETWRANADKFDFSKQRVWCAYPPLKPMPITVRDEDNTADISMPHYYEFTVRYLEREPYRPIMGAVFGRKRGDAEWLPVVEIPPHVDLGKFV